MGKTRWLLILGAVKRALRLIFPIVTALGEIAGTKSAGRLSQLTHYKMLFIMHKIVDFYAPIAKFNGMHQSTHMTISQAQRSWTDLYSKVESLKVNVFSAGSLLSTETLVLCSTNLGLRRNSTTNV